MARYRKIDPRMWGDEKFKSLSKPAPNAQTLWQYLLTGPHTNACPGLYNIGEMALAECLNWPLKEFRKIFKELIDKKMVKVDFVSRVIYIPNSKKYDLPESPNVIKKWSKDFDEIPECELKNQFYQDFKAFLEGYQEDFGKVYHEGFQEAFKAFRKPFGKTMPNPLPKPEPEPKPIKKEGPKPETNLLSLGEFKNIKLSPEKYSLLIEKYTKPITDSKIESFSNSLQSEPKKYSKYTDHYATIQNWIKRDGNKPISKTESNKTFLKCPKCGKETTKDDLNKYESCPSCYKPLPPGKLKELVHGIGKEIK